MNDGCHSTQARGTVWARVAIVPEGKGKTHHRQRTAGEVVACPELDMVKRMLNVCRSDTLSAKSGTKEAFLATVQTFLSAATCARRFSKRGIICFENASLKFVKMSRKHLHHH